MRWMTWILIGMLLCSAGLAAAQDDPTGGTIYGIVIGNNLEVRVGPDYPYEVIAQLPINASVVVTGRAGSQWLRVSYEGGGGWVFARYLRLSGSFSDLPNLALPLPRNRDGRVPDEFDLSTPVCDQWQGDFVLTGVPADGVLNVSFPALRGATLYRVFVFAPGAPITLGRSTVQPFETTDNSASLEVFRIPQRRGTFTWAVAPYWTSDATRYAQQICPLRVAGTFDWLDE